MISWKNNNTLHKSKKDIWRIQEKLIPASIERLEIEMQKRPELKELLLSKIKDLDSKYLNLFDPDDVEKWKELTLYKIINYSLSQKDGVYFYSEAGEDLEGFAYYTKSVNGQHVNDIFIFSFDLDHSSFVIARDMQRLLRELKEKFCTIKFQCIENQPYADAYKKFTKELNGDYRLYNGIWYFEIPGKISESIS